MKKLLLIIMMTAALNVYAVENKDCLVNSKNDCEK